MWDDPAKTLPINVDLYREAKLYVICLGRIELKIHTRLVPDVASCNHTLVGLFALMSLMDVVLHIRVVQVRVSLDS